MEKTDAEGEESEVIIPIYQYRHPKTNEIREIVQSVHAEHRYFGKDGIEWIREFDLPNLGFDEKIDPMDDRGSVEKLRRKNYNLGETMDIAKEASNRREKLMGRDPLKQKQFDRYRKKTGKPHPEEPKKTKWEI